MSLLPPQSYAHPGRLNHHQIYEVDGYEVPNYNGNPLLSNPYLIPQSYPHSPYVPKHLHSKQARHQSGPRLSAGGPPSYSSPFKSASKYILPPGPVYDHQAPVYYGGPHPGHHYHRSFDVQNPYDMGPMPPRGYYPAYTEFDDDPYYGSGRAQSGGLNAEKAIEEIGKIRDLRRAFEDLKTPQDLLDRLQGLKSKGNIGPIGKYDKKKRRKNRKYDDSFESSFATIEQTGSEDSSDTERTEQKIAYVQNYPVVPVNYNGGYALAIVSQPTSSLVLSENQLIAVEPNQIQQVNHPIPVQTTAHKTYRAPEKYIPEQRTLQRGKGSQERSVMSIEEELDKKSVRSDDSNKTKDMLIFGNDAMLNDILGSRRTLRRITTPKKLTHAQHVMQLVEASGNSTHKIPPRTQARKETLEEILIRNRVDEADMKVLKRTLKDVLYQPANLRESQDILESSFTNNNNVSVTKATQK
jgi:hypothetical protein